MSIYSLVEENWREMKLEMGGDHASIRNERERERGVNIVYWNVILFSF